MGLSYNYNNDHLGHEYHLHNNYIQIANEYNLHPSKLAIVWCLLNKNVSTVILGASKQEQLEENLSSIELKPLIDETLIQKLNSI